MLSYDNICLLGIDFKLKKVSIDDEECKVYLWDTSEIIHFLYYLIISLLLDAQERSYTIRKSYYPGIQGVFIGRI